ncbi:hypothetical protein B0T10DRAFT_481143 [Thelonectria olida]|uniref:Zn(2)-C6 fungal-type domain-containing protein n=1 Tax=Thelonectria olida TaxID=1576542 RepID=A0A9P9ARH8_9HYPO|nr:hypothetical protein B0T10DRAFT_481143 [Thelonectria olida]
MSQRHSCDRCRQQKVRCSRGNSQTAPTDPTSLARCERCTKASVNCVYSARQRYNRPSVQLPVRRDINVDPNDPSSASWFAQGLGGVFCPLGPGSGPDFTDLTGPFPGVDDGEAVAGSAGDAEEGSRDVRAMTTCPAIDDENPVDALSSQLMDLSQRTKQTMRRLVRPGGAPPTVSSREVKEAFEDANTLIRIINSMTAASSARGDIAADPTNTDYGLVFLALASHQHLMALFRAICNVIRQCLESMASDAEEQQTRQQSLPHGDVGPSSVAQFVMVLQLLLRLANRMDRSLQVDTSAHYGSESPNSDLATPITPNKNTPLVEPGVKRKAVGGSLPQSSLPILAQSILRTIPDEHEKLRQIIQELQTKIEHL